MPSDIISLYRTRLAREKGTVFKERGGKITVALVYPNTYHLGMSNLGFQFVYFLLNQRPDVVAERAFLPEVQELPLFLQSGKPLLSLETQVPLIQFDLIAFCLPFENDYPNVLKILELAKIPFLAENRNELCPLVIAGGVTTFLNPEPLALFFDFFLLGEAEANLNSLVDHLWECDTAQMARNERIRYLAERIRSLYAPSLYRTEYHSDGTIKSFVPVNDRIPEKVVAARAAAGPIPTSIITTPDTEFSNRVLIEMGRGCPQSCRFCAAGYVYRPPRLYPEESLRSAIEAALEEHRQVGLIAAAVSDIPGIENLTSMIVEKGGTFSVSSLRAEKLTQEFVADLKKSGQKTLAIAPEAGSERLRKVINKHLTETQIVDAVRLIAKTAEFTIRLYFLMGLPTETMEDIRGVVDLVKRIKHHMIKESANRGKIGQVRISMNCFVPKPFTPFQWFGLEQISSLKDKQKWLKKALAREGGVRISFDVPKWAYVQTLLSLGDRRLAPVLLRVHEGGGDWKKALRSSDINPDFFVYRPKGSDEVLPWDFIDHGIRKRHLLREYDLALEGRESDICNVGECVRCGVCVKPIGDAPEG